MDPITIVLIVAAAAVLVALIVVRRRGGTAPEQTTPAAPVAVPAAYRPPTSSFHVSQGEAHVEFSVPLPEGDVDPVLRDILLAEAVEVLRAKRGKLPLEGVSRVRAYALRDGQPVAVGALTLDGPGELPPAAPQALFLPGRAGGGADVFDELSEFDDPDAPLPGIDARLPDDELSPLLDDIRLTSMQDTGLRTQGIDPPAASTAELVAGLLRIAGYVVAGEGTRFTAGREGSTDYVEVVEHAPGAHPELSERSVDEFMARFSSSGADRGLLFTSKYGSYLCYQRERRRPDVRFVTRERFQTFVNSVALG